MRRPTTPRDDDSLDLRDRLSAFEVTGTGVLTMTSRRQRADRDASTDTASYDAVGVLDWTRARPCPGCGERARVDHIDVRRKITTLTCYGCRRPFTVAAADLVDATA